jgi:hypothetical protein
VIISGEKAQKHTVPVVAPPMPVTTRRQSRGLLNPNVISGPSEDSPTTNFMRESEDDDVPMDGSITRSSASEDEEEYELIGDEHESDVSEGESSHEESDDIDFNEDFEGMFNAANGHASCADCVHSKTSRSKTS